MNPKVGEYWYAQLEQKYSWDQLEGELVIRVCKILGVSSKGIVIQMPFWQTGHTDRKFLLAKWEPNWFWRLIGYK